MTNAMPPLQMMIKLSYGWRPLPLPCIGTFEYAKMYGNFVDCYDFAVHCYLLIVLYCREGQVLPLR